jgi:hypothetical protein
VIHERGSKGIIFGEFSVSPVTDLSVNLSDILTDLLRGEYVTPSQIVKKIVAYRNLTRREICLPPVNLSDRLTDPSDRLTDSQKDWLGVFLLPFTPHWPLLQDHLSTWVHLYW